jgi:hypothetical protein
MANPVKFKLEMSEFNRTLKKYRELSSRDPETIANTKAFYIARRATVVTPKANKSKIKRDLLSEITTEIKLLGQRIRITKSGIKRGKFITEKITAPLVALIINARRGKKGLRGLEGNAMAEASNLLIAIRLKSVAFIKSGWLPAIKALEPLAAKGRAPNQDRTAETVGAQKGGAMPARGFWKAVATIWNSAEATRDNKRALVTYGGPALQQAVDFEESSMRQYIEDKLKETAKAAGVKVK